MFWLSSISWAIDFQQVTLYKSSNTIFTGVCCNKHLSQEAVMTVRVVIEREVGPGRETKLQQLMMQARSKAIKSKGYISGETLRALDNPNKFLVISNWNSAEDWHVWEKHPDRAKLQTEIAPLLLGKEKCTVYMHF